MSVRPIYQDKREVGKNIKSSKVLFLWKFNLEDRDYTIELYNSMLSGKKKITQNGQIIYENNAFQGAFNFPFHIGKNSLSIVQHGDRFELRINNQSFEHLYNQKMTKHHFATDSFGANSSSFKSSSNYGPRVPPPKSNAANEDEEIRKAIELSKQTAKDDEEKRKRHLAKQPKSGEKDDFDVGLGFEKFATGAGADPNDIDDFDFGNLGGSHKKEEYKQEEQFNFDVGSNAAQAKSAAPGESTDLMDLLSGGPVQTNNQPQQQNALDFFSQGAGQGNLGQAAAQNSQNNSAYNFGGAGQSGASFGASPAVGVNDPFSPSTNTNSFVSQTAPTADPEKPKFQPNPLFASGLAANPQQQYQLQMQQMQMQQQMMYQTQMGVQQQYNQAQAMQMQGNGGQSYGTAMPAYGGGMQGGMQSAPQQQSNPFDFNGNAGQQQQQQQQNPQGTPFDMF